MVWTTRTRREPRRHVGRLGATVAAVACMSVFLTPALALVASTPASAAGNAVLPTDPAPGLSLIHI